MIKNVLITGGAGYIGSSLVSLLLSKGYNVVVYDNLSFGGEPLLGALACQNFKLIKGDVTDFKAVEIVFKNNNIDAVVHLAAIVGDPACAKQPELATKVNYDSSVNLFNCAVKNKVKRFIFASTCSNYGKMVDPGGYVNEESPLAPVSLYAELKVKTEKYILENEQKNNGFSPTVLRFATAYGVSPRVRFDLTVNEFTKELALGKELVVFGEQFWRPYCHVDDICRAVVKVLESESSKISGNVFNVGDTQENYQKQLIVEAIKKVIPEARVKYVKKNEDPRDYRVSFEKIKSQLGFTISKRLVDGINEIKFLIDNKVLLNPEDSKYKNV
ncbi:MAG: NAD-dependent epimerase/dehydratase family protein [Candidatus Omnitrophota bacterium]